MGKSHAMQSNAFDRSIKKALTVVVAMTEF